MDRGAMYEGWVTVEVMYDGRQFKHTSYNEEMVGTANPYNISFNRVWSELRSVNPKIELMY